MTTLPPASKAYKLRPFDGSPYLDLAVQLDAHCPSFLSFAFAASPLRRQAIFSALAALSEERPEDFAARFQQLAPADSPCPKPYGQIARALMTARARRILYAVYGSLPNGLLGTFCRLGDVPLSEPKLYRIIFDTFALREYRRLAKILMNRSGFITATHIEVLHALDPLLVHENILDHVYSASQANDANAALALVRGTVTSVSDGAIRQSIESLSKKSNIGNLFNNLLEKMDLPPVRLPIPEDDPDLVALTSGEAIREMARRYRNCGASKIPLVAVGALALAEWKNAPGAIAEFNVTTKGQFVLVDVHVAKNGIVKSAAATAVCAKVKSLGIPSLSLGCYPRARGILRLLNVWDGPQNLSLEEDDEDEDDPLACLRNVA